MSIYCISFSYSLATLFLTPAECSSLYVCKWETYLYHRNDPDNVWPVQKIIVLFFPRTVIVFYVSPLSVPLIPLLPTSIHLLAGHQARIVVGHVIGPE